MARWNWGRVSVLPFTILVHLVGILCVALVLVWMIHFRGGLAWSTSNQILIFNIHPVLMIVCFIFLSSEAIVHFKSAPGSKFYKKTIHSALNAIALTGAIVGVAAVFKFHKELGIANLYSLHAWLGMLTIILFGLQWMSGFLVFLFPRGAKKTRGRVLPWHVFVGLLVYIAAISSAESGIVELVALLQGRNAMGKFSPEARLANCLGLSLLLLGALVVLSSVLSSPSPATKPEDAIAIPSP
ncbi:hypothetical protein O6H91_19G014200 [Diphasiastrum complanatum]|uniref:Uncharacterized protein n=1 Tax=Diphasiastrum complanatum TaxID=34168 RepID=A0ACC2AT18_DIPCM|nr:hypothetical protein O6H91_19G014200 [Diphasiastrum complanatum]